MSTGGRSGARGRGSKKGPDMAWDDEEPTETVLNTRQPGPLFPDRYIPVPKPPSTYQKKCVDTFLKVRDRVRRGPLYTTLDPTLISPTTGTDTSSSAPKSRAASSLANKVKSRAGFDPFNDQEKYTKKYHPKVRTIADLTDRPGYTLRLFPHELWSVLDPKRKMKEWQTLTEEQKARIFPSSSSSTGAAAAGKKRKRNAALKFDDEEGDSIFPATLGSRKGRGGSDDNLASDDDDDDANSNRENSNEEDEDDENDGDATRRKRRKQDKGGKTGKKDDARSRREKKGFDAEDEYPDIDQQDNNNDDDADGAGGGGGGGGGDPDDEPGDSEFGTDEEDEEGMDDYNAEQYFDDGADDADGGLGGDGDDEPGGFY